MISFFSLFDKQDEVDTLTRQVCQEINKSEIMASGLTVNGYFDMCFVIDPFYPFLSALFINIIDYPYSTLSQTIPCFYGSEVQVFRKHCGKRRNCS